MNKDETTEESKLTADFLFDENQTYDNDAPTWRIKVQNDKVEFLLVTTDKIFKINKSNPISEQLLFDKLYKGSNVSSVYGNSTIATSTGNATISTHSVSIPVPSYQVTISPSTRSISGQISPVPPVSNTTPNKTPATTKISNQLKKLFMSGGKHNDIK